MGKRYTIEEARGVPGLYKQCDGYFKAHDEHIWKIEDIDWYCPGFLRELVKDKDMGFNDPIGPPPQANYYIAPNSPCVPPYPYIGDYPPYVPPAQIPGSGSTTNKLFPPKENKMTVYMIWGVAPDFPDKPFLLAAIDADSRADDEDGWEEKLGELEEVYGARFIRVTKSSVNYDAVAKAFGEAEV